MSVPPDVALESLSPHPGMELCREEEQGGAAAFQMWGWGLGRQEEGNVSPNIGSCSLGCMEGKAYPSVKFIQN